MATNDLLVLVIVIGMRSVVPLALFRWPFWGALACIFADGVDTMIQDALGSSILTEHYHNIDKVFDTYYLAIEAWIAFHWADPLARWTATVLFGLRILAAGIYEVTDIRGVLFYLGPNIFENFYLWVAGFLTIDPAYRIRSGRRLALILLVVGLPKLLQEYVMHYLDSQTWHFVKRYIFQWR